MRRGVCEASQSIGTEGQFVNHHIEISAGESSVWRVRRLLREYRPRRAASPTRDRQKPSGASRTLTLRRRPSAGLQTPCFVDAEHQFLRRKKTSSRRTAASLQRPTPRPRGVVETSALCFEDLGYASLRTPHAPARRRSSERDPADRRRPRPPTADALEDFPPVRPRRVARARSRRAGRPSASSAIAGHTPMMKVRMSAS